MCFLNVREMKGDYRNTASHISQGKLPSVSEMALLLSPACTLWMCLMQLHRPSKAGGKFL